MMDDWINIKTTFSTVIFVFVVCQLPLWSQVNPGPNHKAVLFNSTRNKCYTKGNAVLRVCPSINCQTSFQLSAKTPLTILDSSRLVKSSIWYKVNANGSLGYIESGEVVCRNNALTKPSQYTSQILEDDVNVRSGPGIEYQKSDQLKLASQCKILKEYPKEKLMGEYHPWYYIEYDHGRRKGYVYGKYVSDIPIHSKNRKIFLIAVSIGDYSHELNNLGIKDLFSSNGAKHLFQFYKSRQGGNLPPNQIVMLRDEHATVNNTLSKIRSITKMTDEDDVLIFYFSGHGDPNTLLFHDGHISHRDLLTILNESKSKTNLVITDACHSASLG